MNALEETRNRIGRRFSVYPNDDNSWIELLDVLPHPATGITGDQAIVQAARVSYLGESKGDDADKKLLNYLMKNAHTSPFEMVEVKMRISMPVVAAWQLVRHRTANFNAQSGRYTKFDEDKFYIPTEWRKQSENNKQSSSGELLSDEDQRNIRHDLKEYFGDGTPFDYFQTESYPLEYILDWYIKTGYKIYDTLLQHGAAKEQARLFLPGWSSYYVWVVKFDLHNFLHFLKLRLHPHAQYEIRAYAEIMYNEIVKPCFPWVAEAFEKFRLKDHYSKE